MLESGLTIILFVAFWLIWRQAKITKGPVRLADTTENDVFMIGSQRVKLWAVDTFTGGQPWYPENGLDSRNMHEETRKALQHWLEKRTVVCRHVADEPAKGWRRILVRSNRIVCRCSVDDDDVGLWLLSNGYAVINHDFIDQVPRLRRRYLEAEENARSNGIGIWAGNFLKPNQWYHFGRK